jgi:hypothetical protein
MHDHLVPIGNTGIWVTPNEPVDPRDCDRWPDSPYCTSVGIDPLNAGIQSGIDLATQGEIGYDTFDPLSGLGIDEYSAINDLASRGRTFNPWNLANLEPSVTINSCEQCITITPTLFYISLPPYTICSRATTPECLARLQPEPPPPPDALPDDIWQPNTTGAGHSMCWYRVAITFGITGYNDNYVTRGPITGMLIRFTSPTTYWAVICSAPNDFYPNGNRGGGLAQNIRNQDGVITPFPRIVSIRRYTGPPALIGEFPIDIKIQDVDPLTEGNQEQEIKLMNVAETLTELYALAAKSSINGDLHTNFLTRLAAEVIATKNASIVTQDYARANAQFLGYKGNPKKRKIPYAFDPESLDSLEKLLKNSEKFVQGWQEDDPESVVNYLQKIVFSAGIIKAVFFRGGSQATQLISELRNLIDPESDVQQTRNEDWEAFLRAINDPEGRFNADSATRPHIVDPEIEL